MPQPQLSTAPKNIISQLINSSFFLRSTINYQLPTTNCQLPTINCQLSTINCQLPTANCQLPTANCQLSSRVLRAISSWAVNNFASFLPLPPLA
ncbi:MAG: hypothetical protein JGK08_15560 [Microcoleus sp. PH2017_04_SCI_O_A]|nr:hypothetical protein [Microcoleus sp. PH2017_04_SCI_O_A]